jgi:hypothetical protein
MLTSGLTQKELDFIEELELMEEMLLDKIPNLANDLIAKGLTYLAHDYITMGLEEKGHLLLLKADELYPGYHKTKMAEDMKNDPDFAILVRSLSAELILVALSTARDSR